MGTTVALAATLSGPAEGGTGPSSSAAPYLVPTHEAADIASLLTVGDSVNQDPDAPGLPYWLVGGQLQALHFPVRAD